MKNQFLTIFCVLTVAFTSCVQTQDKALTSEEKSNIKEEISIMIDSIKKSANELRTDYFKKVYWNDDQFIGVDLTGAKDFDVYMKETDEMYADMKSIEFMEDEVSMVVFDDKTVMALFEGKAKGENKEGVIMNLNNFNASMLFRKVDGEWKLVYTHESAEQEIMMPADSTIVEQPME